MLQTLQPGQADLNAFLAYRPWRMSEPLLQANDEQSDIEAKVGVTFKCQFSSPQGPEIARVQVSGGSLDDGFQYIVSWGLMRQSADAPWIQGRESRGRSKRETESRSLGLVITLSRRQFRHVRVQPFAYFGELVRTVIE